MEKLLNYLTKIPRDKVYHALAGLTTYGVISIFNPLVAIIVVVLLAISKEVYDYFNKDKHTVDIWDAIVTAIVPLILYGIEILWVKLNLF